jgi:succinylarginine dihydrolase
MSNANEWNFDGIVGSTHHYGGLSFGNIASTVNANRVSHPKAAALQGLKKMKLLSELGLKQGFFPPHERPHMMTLRKLGFRGTDREIILAAAAETPDILSLVYSSSFMWTANAATISPFADTGDGRTHFTAANLNNKFHRLIEAEFTSHLLKVIFPSTDYFMHHPVLPDHEMFGDEGAANHTRFCADYGGDGIHFFVYGREGNWTAGRFPARQTLAASKAVARQHALSMDKVCFAKQNPEAIDAGAFHNDVVAVGNRNVLFCHEKAYENFDFVLSESRAKFSKCTGIELQSIIVPQEKVSLDDAIHTYLFNSQLVSLSDREMVLICPEDCRSNPRVFNYIEGLLGDEKQPIRKVHFVPLRESMDNGGGPACLRLRVVLNEMQEKEVHQGCVFTNEKYELLKKWVDKHYRDDLYSNDLVDPQLLEESQVALDDLTQILELGSIYSFQQ